MEKLKAKAKEIKKFDKTLPQLDEQRKWRNDHIIEARNRETINLH